MAQPGTRVGVALCVGVVPLRVQGYEVRCPDGQKDAVHQHAGYWGLGQCWGHSGRLGLGGGYSETVAFRGNRGLADSTLISLCLGLILERHDNIVAHNVTRKS